MKRKFWLRYYVFLFTFFVSCSKNVQVYKLDHHSPIYTTYAAEINHSNFIIDQGYELQYSNADQPFGFSSEQGGDFFITFKSDSDWVYTISEMASPPLITNSYPNLVTVELQPFKDLLCRVDFLVESSNALLVDIRIINNLSEKKNLEIISFYNNDYSPLDHLDINENNAFFDSHKYPDSWTINHKIPYHETLKNIFTVNDLHVDIRFLNSDGYSPKHPEATLKNFGFEQPNPEIPDSASILAFRKKYTLKPNQSEKLRFIRVTNSPNKQNMLNKQAEDLEKIHFENYLNESKQLFKSIENNYSFANEDIELLWRSSFNMMRQVFYPPEGNLSNNYYVFSREPIWGWGHGGQVFHESITMLAYALLDPVSAMNSQRVYAETQHPNGYINYRTGAYLNEVIEHNGQLTTSAPWYCWLNWEVYVMTGDKEFLKEMYASSKAFYNFYIATRDTDSDGLCEWGGHAVLESVRDGLVAVWDEVTWPANLDGVDINSMLVKEAKSLEKMARELGLEDEASHWKNDYLSRTQLINQYCWDEKQGFYYNVDKRDNDFTYSKPNDLKRDEIIGFLPLWAGIANQEQAKSLVEKLTDPNAFWREYGIPSLSAADPYYNPKGYWNGPVWVEWNFLIMRGLIDYGYHKEAKELVQKVVNGMLSQLKANHNLWEFYSPDHQWGGYHKTYIWAGIINRMMLDVGLVTQKD